jgi:hypothetical protein
MDHVGNIMVLPQPLEGRTSPQTVFVSVLLTQQQNNQQQLIGIHHSLISHFSFYF